MTSHADAHVGRFRFPVSGDRWWWSDGMYEIHGMSAGAIVPTAAVLSRHVHPDDRERVTSLLEASAEHGEPFGCQYRLLDLEGREHDVTLSGVGERDAAGALEAVSGFLVDVSAEQRDVVARAVNSQLAQALRSHAVIDQAKGALMLVYGIDGDAAFELLRWSSQQRNVRLLTLAERLVASIERSGGLALGVRQTVDEQFASSLEQDAEDAGAPPGQAEPTLHLRTGMREGAPVVSVEGALDLATVGELVLAVQAQAVHARESGALVVDLRGAQHVGSAAVSVLSSAQRRNAAAGVRMQVLARPGTARALVGVEGLDVVVADLPRLVTQRGTAPDTVP